jgi:hypothetical protein
MEKNPTQKSLKIKSFFGYPSCPKNKRVLFLGHNSITIYPIDMRLFAPQTLFVFTCLGFRVYMLKDWNLVKISVS